MDFCFVSNCCIVSKYTSEHHNEGTDVSVHSKDHKRPMDYFSHLSKLADYIVFMIFDLYKTCPNS